MIQLPQKPNNAIRIIFGIIGIAIFIIGFYTIYRILVSLSEVISWGVESFRFWFFADYLPPSSRIGGVGLVITGIFITILVAILIANMLKIAYTLVASAIQDESPKEIWQGWLGGRVVRYCWIGFGISMIGTPVLSFLTYWYTDSYPYVGIVVHEDILTSTEGWSFSLWDLSIKDQIEVDCNRRDYYKTIYFNSSSGWKFVVLDLRIFNYLNETLVFKAKDIRDKEGIKYNIENVYLNCKESGDDYYNTTNEYWGRLIQSRNAPKPQGMTFNGSDQFEIIYMLPITSVPDEFNYEIYPKNYSNTDNSRSGSIYLGKFQKHID